MLFFWKSVTKMYQNEKELSFCTVILNGCEGTPTIHLLVGDASLRSV